MGLGSNVITVEVTAEDGETTKTYAVTVTRADSPPPSPAATIDFCLPASVTEGTEFDVTMSFANLVPDDHADLTFRADVVGADACEESGWSHAGSSGPANLTDRAAVPEGPFSWSGTTAILD